MGHLTRIANCIVHSADKGPGSALVQQLLKGERFRGFRYVFLASEDGLKDKVEMYYF